MAGRLVQCRRPFSTFVSFHNARHDRRLMNVPLDATHFAWAFPLSGVADVADRAVLAPTTREAAFAAFGGFVYLNAGFADGVPRLVDVLGDSSHFEVVHVHAEHAL